MKSSKKVAASALALTAPAIGFSNAATALTSTFNVSIEFFDAFTATETTPSTFGRIISGVATTYYMDSSGNITAGAGGSATGGVPSQGNYNLADSSTGEVIDILVDNPVADAGVSITAFDCDWNGGAITDSGATCTFDGVGNPTGVGMGLALGFWIAVDGTQNSLDVANPTFDITVTYD